VVQTSAPAATGTQPMQQAVPAALPNAPAASDSAPAAHRPEQLALAP